MRFKVTIDIDVTHVQGKFAGRDEIEELVTSAIMEANPGDIETDDGAEYNVEFWEIEKVEKPK